MSVGIFDQDGQAIDAMMMAFAGGERHVQLDPDLIHKLPAPRRITLRARLANSEDVFDLLLLADALVQIDPAVRLRLELPYLPYARQDRVCAPGQAFSLNVFARVLAGIPNVERLVTWDCHSPVGLRETGARNVPADAIVTSSPELLTLMRADDSVIVAPDKGAVARTDQIATSVQAGPVVYASKVRDPETGLITHTEVSGAELAGKTAIITDDICDGGFTFTLLAQALRDQGVARIILFVTHGIFSRGLDVFDGLIDRIFTTDSFDQDADERLVVIPFAHQFEE
jgi:ribose-phosphate pyrophosphokinase